MFPAPQGQEAVQMGVRRVLDTRASRTSEAHCTGDSADKKLKIPPGHGYDGAGTFDGGLGSQSLRLPPSRGSKRRDSGGGWKKGQAGISDLAPGGEFSIS